MTKYWLMKSEPSECSFDDVYNKPNKTVDWFGIRNYQARNFIRDEMTVGDGVLFYHSNCKEPGIVGVATIASTPYPDMLQFEPASEYFDEKSNPAKPRWLAIDVECLYPTRLISLNELKENPHTQGMRVCARGNRLSITPVTEEEFHYITEVLAKK
ncbi:MAG: EVE domain-containing protein [Sutterellaceae bacterium]|nr:EVE domain-containing protein [Sutterellaceae bacterium]